MADIPAEVTKFERAVAQHSFWASTETPEEIETERALLIARQEIKDFILAERERATLVERERCALIADDHAQRWDSPKGRETAACFQVAAAIREGQTQ